MLATFALNRVASLLSWGSGRGSAANEHTASAAVANVGHAYAAEEFVFTSPDRPSLGGAEIASAHKDGAHGEPNVLGVVPHVATTQARLVSIACACAWKRPRRRRSPIPRPFTVATVVVLMRKPTRVLSLRAFGAAAG